MPTEERLVELEIRIAHQDKVIADLDEVLRAFASRVEVIEEQLRALRGATADVGPVGPANEPPPHY